MILQDIVKDRKAQLEREKKSLPLAEAEKQAQSAPWGCCKFREALEQGRRCLSIIGEIKKASPSKGVISEEFHPALQARAYEEGGIDAISCLTEEAHFQGSEEIFRQVRQATDLPLLRKDFILEPYQIVQSRAMGADAVLLICAILTPKSLSELMSLAHQLDMECLVEVHNPKEMAMAMEADAPIIGINNRNLEDFSVDLRTTRLLARLAPSSRTLVSESGLRRRADMQAAWESGVQSVLIGEALMRAKEGQPEPSTAAGVSERLAKLGRGY